MANKTENIAVVVRCRPFSETEKKAGHSNIVEIDSSRGSVVIKSPKDSDEKAFTFDAAFDQGSAQIDVYNQTARFIVDAVLDGFNGTVFAYGQTGTGKTFSMQGVKDVPELRGIIPNAFNHIFDHIASTSHKQFLVRVSFLEIYNEDIRDLLAKNTKNKLDLKEHPETGVYVRDLSAFVVKSIDEMEQYMNLGNANRSVGATLMNENSSRSHSIFSITVESSEVGPDGQNRIVAGKLHLVDLAGSERQSKTGASGDRLKEATKINLSLSALGNCISALVDGKSSHIPYRDSKLTRLLQDSLGGNSKTLMLATLSPASYNFDETLSTLRYANRAKNIKNKPKINEDPKDALLRSYQEEIERLRQELLARQNGEGGQVTKVVKKKKVKKDKVPRVRPDGTVVQEEEEEEDESMPDLLADVDPETLARLQAEVEAEKQALVASKDIALEEKQRIAAELEQRAAELEKERQDRENLADKLKSIESKLLVGGVNIAQRVNEQEKEIQSAHYKLQEQQRIQRELEQKLEAKQEAQLQMEENYASLQEEVDVKSKKLKKLWSKIEDVKAEITDLQDEFRNEREDLLDTIRELSRELALKTVIIDNFIPPDERAKVETRASYDDELDEWALEPMTTKYTDNRMKRLTSLKNLPRPLCMFARNHVKDPDRNPRYYSENILSIGLDLPDRTTFPTSPTRAQKQSGLQGALDFAMGDDDNEVMEVGHDSMEHVSYGERPSTRTGRPQTRARSVRMEESEHSQARGGRAR